MTYTPIDPTLFTENRARLKALMEYNIIGLFGVVFLLVFIGLSLYPFGILCSDNYPAQAAYIEPAIFATKFSTLLTRTPLHGHGNSFRAGFGASEQDVCPTFY